jgi:hypothetical protein
MTSIGEWEAGRMPVDIVEIEQRLTSVETALIQVRQRLGLPPPTGNWVEQISGSLADIPEDDYQQFLQCCETVRHGDSAQESA